VIVTPESDERERLDDGPLPGQQPTGMLRALIASCPDGNALDVEQRCKDVLRVVLVTQALENDGVWRTVLPDWFVTASASGGNAGVADEDPEAPWQLEAWLSWFVNPEFELNRPWYWWRSSVIDPTTLLIEVEVEKWPFPYDALRWLATAAGATELREENLRGSDS